MRKKTQLKPEERKERKVQVKHLFANWLPTRHSGDARSFISILGLESFRDLYDCSSNVVVLSHNAILGFIQSNYLGVCTRNHSRASRISITN